MYAAAIIGGGASGLLAACLLSRQGVSVLLLEGESRVGKKLLTTGSGRCNLSHRAVSSASYHGGESLPVSFFDRFSCERIRETFASLGLLCREDGEGRIYPYSMQAASVLDALRFSCEKNGVETVCGFPVSSLEAAEKGFRIIGETGKSYEAKRVILACGSPAGQGNHFTGYELAKQAGHSLRRPEPALVPLLTDPRRVRALKGLRCRAKASLLKGEQVIREETGEVQFTENALSGICIFDLSCEAEKGMTVSLDLMPEYTEEQIALWLCGADLAGALPRRIAEAVLKETGSAAAEETARRVKHFSFPVLGREGFSRAQAAKGGVLLREISVDTMESAICPGLYLTGELLDVNGDCGGYNLHFAWSSAMAAAEHILKGAEAS